MPKRTQNLSALRARQAKAQRATGKIVVQGNDGKTFREVLMDEPVDIKGGERFITVPKEAMASFKTKNTVLPSKFVPAPNAQKGVDYQKREGALAPMLDRPRGRATISDREDGLTDEQAEAAFSGVVKNVLGDNYHTSEEYRASLIEASYKGGILKELKEKEGEDWNEHSKAHYEQMAAVLEDNLIPETLRHSIADAYHVALNAEEAKLKGERQQAQAEANAAKLSSDTMDDFQEWGAKHRDNFVLQPNECSRLHMLVSNLKTGVSVSNLTKEQFETPQWPWERVQTFVVKHDWAAVMAEHLEGAEFVLPYPDCAFEFKINGRVFIVTLSTADDTEVGTELNDKTRGSFFTEGKNGVWLAFDSNLQGWDIYEFMMKHILSMCVVLEAGVAEETLVKQPEALNAKRKKNGKLPLSDYHIVDLSKRHRAPERGPAEPTGRKVRLHFRRGHWVHADAQPEADQCRRDNARWTPYGERWRTWKKWQLVGNPELGFIEKHYKL